MSYRNLPFGTADAFNVVIEIPKGSQNKYEYDEELDLIKLDWVFTEGFCFPFDYGYIPQTRGGDGDHLDAFVLSSFPIEIGTICQCRAIGIIKLLDRGEEDDKVLAIPLVDPELGNISTLSDFKENYEQMFREFFKGLEKQKNKIIDIKEFCDNAKAKEELSRAHEIFITNKK